uniref:Uncharacterized protein n=1 Tax=Desulfovibrio sp. U5L TaxID=596152 RepID=I2Q053_9BACT
MRISGDAAIRYNLAFGIPLPDLCPEIYGGRLLSSPLAPAWIVHTPGVGLTCTACRIVAEGVTLDSPEGRQFVADHSGHEDPYPAMRQGREEEGVGA